VKAAAIKSMGERAGLIMEIKKLLRVLPHPGRDESRSLDKSGTYNAHPYAGLFC